ncbi:ATP-binding cassette, subfamily B, MsbA [Brevinema andersonii]|uniref:ATP-binding cassette, subfamily B, MsbA n=1 Tax=Brevinema andersonii TaxID=34097 RepID=A0A1I1CZC8_BREAD|nr:ABC transporter ATP-binding protein [Brevinema andersonii]SFB68025.1 ATP-binding cassette, subfamily B, MsbA [Brevinema andersonii]
MKQVTPIRRLFSMLRHYKLQLTISVISALLFVTGRTGISTLIGDFINGVFITQNLSLLNVKTIGILFGFAFLWSGAQYTMYLFSGKLAIRVAHTLRSRLYQKLVKLPVSYYRTHDSSEILSIASNDITLVETFLTNVMVQLLAQPLTVIAIISMMFVINWKLSLYFIVLGPAIALILGLIGTQVQKLGRSMQENIAHLTKIFAETIRHIIVIKGFNSEHTEIARFKKKNDHQLDLADKEIKIRLLALPASDFLGITAVILLLALGAVGIRAGIADTASVTKFVAMAIVLSEPISSFNQLILVVKKLGPSLERVFNILNTPEEHETGIDIGSIKGYIQFESVNFWYVPERQILYDIDLEIQPRETIALIGMSGSGKSTLVSLIPKLFKPESGKILIDGKNIAEFSASSIREKIAIVTQDTSLFSDTIRNNITLSKPNATYDEIVAATTLANAHQFIDKFPLKYQTEVGDYGSNLSGGERQRIILARAVLRKPQILLLDEPTSALDAESEQAVTQALENIYRHQTTIIIAHKLSTIEKADRIVVMQDGRIIEYGTHQELLALKGLYTKLRTLNKHTI